MARAVWRALCNGGLAVCAMADATIRSEAGETKRRSIEACFLLILLSACWLVGLLASLLLGFLLFGPVLCLSSQSRHSTTCLFDRSPDRVLTTTLSEVNGCDCSAGDAVRARCSHSLRTARRQPPAAELAPAQRQPLPHAVPASQRLWLLLYVGDPEPSDYVHAGRCCRRECSPDPAQLLSALCAP